MSQASPLSGIELPSPALPRSQRWLTWLTLGTSLTLLARGWLTWRWDSPIRGLFWQEDWWSPLLDRVGLSWKSWAENSDAFISPFLDVLGIFLVLAAIIPWLARAGVKRGTGWLWPAFGVLEGVYTFIRLLD